MPTRPVRAPSATSHVSAGAAPRVAGSAGVSASSAPSAREDLRRRDHLVAVPRALRVERHLLDEPQLVAVLEGEPQQSGTASSSLTPRSSTVLSFIGASPASAAARRPGEDVGQPVAVGDPGEPLAVEGVDGDVDPLAVRRRPGPARGGRGRARSWSAPSAAAAGGGAQLARRDEDLLEAAPQQRLAAGEPDLLDAEPLDGDRGSAGRSRRR